MRTCTLYVQDHEKMEHGQAFTEDWLLPRREALKYHSKLPFKSCPQEMFDLTNQPFRLGVVAEYHGPSMSVGDICKVEEPGRIEYFLCTAAGWKSKSLSSKGIIQILQLIS